MGERVRASIQLGGKLPKSLVPELIRRLNRYCLVTDDYEDPTPDNLGEKFSDDEVNYGVLDDVTVFAHEHGLYYRYYCSSGSEWLETTVFYDPIRDEVTDVVGHTHSELAVPERLLRTFTSIEQCLTLLDRVRAELPPLEIVDD